jgi:hypothetical protein
VFENRVLRRIFGPKREEVTGDSRKLHNEELHDFKSSPSIIRMMKSRRMTWAGHVARMGVRGMHIEFWCESQKERDHWKGLDVGGRIILKCMLESGTDWIHLTQNKRQWRALVNTVIILRVP